MKYKRFEKMKNAVRLDETYKKAPIGTVNKKQKKNQLKIEKSIFN